MTHLSIGLTGGIGSGKSSASRIFSELQINIVDADLIARQVVEPGSPALQKITQHFGTEILQHDGSLDRHKLGTLVFSAPKQLNWLNQLMQPLIRQEILSQLKHSTSPYTILDAPLLLEHKLQSQVDRVLVVDCPTEQQIQRCLKRDKTKDIANIKNIIQTQMPRAERIKLATDIIDNSGNLQQLKQQVLRLHHSYIRLCGQEC